MPNIHIWVRTPYPFRWEEQQAIQEAIWTTYGVKAVYLQEWPAHYVSIDTITLTLAKKVADTIKFLHRYAAIHDRRRDSRVYAENAEVEIRGILDGRPAWMKEEESA